MNHQNQISIGLTSLALGTGLLSGSILEQFNFDDPSNTAIQSVVNSGNGDGLTHPDAGTNTFETNGNGQAVFTSSAEGIFRNPTFFTPLTTGEYFLRVDFDSHTIASSGDTKTFGYGFRNNGTASNLVVRLNKNNSDSVRIDVFDGNNTGTGGNNTSAVNVDFAGLSDSVGIGTILALDLASGTYDLYTDVGLTGGFVQVLTDVPLANAASIPSIDALRFQAQNLATGDIVAVEQVAFSDSLSDALDGSIVPVDIDTFPTAGGKFLDLSNTDEAINGFVIPGDGTATYNAPGTSLFRTRDLSSTIASGKAYLRIDLSSYDSADSTSDNFQLGLRDASDNRVSLQLNSFDSGDAKRLRVLPAEAGIGGSTTSVFGVSNLSDAFATSAILEIDIDANTYSSYFGSPGNYTLVDDAVALGYDIGTLTELRLGIQNMEDTDVIGFDLVLIDDDFASISTFGAATSSAPVITDCGVSGGNFVATFTSSTAVDVYRSSDLVDFGTTPIASNVAAGTDVILDAVSATKAFYILVPTGSPAP